ncbi:MAG: neutral zinc metallopeptidase [Chloroflexota bacterium]|nr:neutral zinc metallopeptidase [Chloroflexota bacterium]
MIWRTVWLIAMVVVTLSPVTPVAAQTAFDAQAASIAAYELSVMESLGDFNGLYDRIHPDAHAVVPRAAAVGWFEQEFAPRGPGVSVVTGVEFGPWTWEVTGKTYPNTATVSFRQPFADGSVVDDVVRLVQDDRGEWRWFFGRDQAFVDAQIARFVEPNIQQSGTISAVDVAIDDLDTFWSTVFGGASRAYIAPGVVPVGSIVDSPCGTRTPENSPAGYCRIDGTIYYTNWFFTAQETQFGNYAWVNILAHEWGHHVQNSLGLAPQSDNTFELQADCLAGAYARDAATRGLLDPGDVTEAVKVSAEFGDDPLWPQDRPGAHGTNDERIVAFMRGYLDGFIGCNLPIHAMSPQGSGEQPAPLEASNDTTSLAALLPDAGDFSYSLIISDDRSRSLQEITANYSNPADAEQRFRGWGWRGNAIRTLSAPADDDAVEVFSIYVSLHEFASASAARAALDYSFDDQLATTSAAEDQTIRVGAYGRAARNWTGEGNELTIYSQQGALLLRVTVVSSGSDPQPVAREVVELVFKEPS